MMSTSALVAEGGHLLGSNAEARTLLAHAAGVDANRLALLAGVGEGAVCDYRQLVRRRVAGEPVQYLTGRAAFRTIEVRVSPGVFIPRPETEVMTGWAIEQLTQLDHHAVVVELCAGSGAISAAIAAEMPGVTQHCVELSETAAKVAAVNLCGSGVDLRVGDMADAFPDLNGHVDLVIANPPYIPLESWEHVAEDVRTHEPDLALFSGLDGLDALRVVAQVAARLLRPGGRVCAEHAEVQSAAVVRLFADCGAFTGIADHPDLNDRPRFVTGVRVANLAG
jgi:release factor glutamine methyltransferase